VFLGFCVSARRKQSTERKTREGNKYSESDGVAARTAPRATIAWLRRGSGSGCLGQGTRERIHSNRRKGIAVNRLSSPRALIAIRSRPARLTSSGLGIRPTLIRGRVPRATGRSLTIALSLMLLHLSSALTPATALANTFRLGLERIHRRRRRRGGATGDIATLGAVLGGRREEREVGVLAVEGMILAEVIARGRALALLALSPSDSSSHKREGVNRGGYLLGKSRGERASAYSKGGEALDEIFGWIRVGVRANLRANRLRRRRRRERGGSSKGRGEKPAFGGRRKEGISKDRWDRSAFGGSERRRRTEG
ncbi:hypothetical protein BDP67DRAFT_601843, partial [Colletotrichum lupini]